VRSILIDTGAIIALLNPADRFHQRAVDCFAGLRGTDRVLTTWPVITECTFALIRNRGPLFDWLELSGIEIENFVLDDVDFMRRWMDRYTDREIDFADASLVWLAMKSNTNLIATTDFNDFETVRLPNRKSFRILLAR
jgi:uncharacterized protein